MEIPEPEEITGVHPFEVETSQAYEAAREVAKTDGILIGTSSGSAIYAATLLAYLKRIRRWYEWQ